LTYLTDHLLESLDRLISADHPDGLGARLGDNALAYLDRVLAPQRVMSPTTASAGSTLVVPPL
jgi:hypothetical protein